MHVILGRGEILALDAGCSATKLVCRQGLFWITREGDGRDHLLRPGQAMNVAGRGRTLVMPLGGSSLLDCLPVAGEAPGPGRVRSLFSRKLQGFGFRLLNPKGISLPGRP